MDEVIAGLWIGNLGSALDTETPKAKGIYSILSAMRGKVSIHEASVLEIVEFSYHKLVIYLDIHQASNSPRRH